MSRELVGYRDNLEDILQFFGGRRVLTVSDVKSYTGIKNHGTVKKMFPFKDNHISAPVLARCLSPGGEGA